MSLDKQCFEIQDSEVTKFGDLGYKFDIKVSPHNFTFLTRDFALSAHFRQPVEMNSIRTIQELNKRELENNVSTSASWHTDYRDTAYIYIGGLPHELSEGDVVTIFSQYGEPTYINLVRDKETGKSRGFAFLKYEDQRSCDLAVDNLGGATIMGRMLKVDHTRYKRKDGEEEEEREQIMRQTENGKGDESDEEDAPSRPLLKEEVELRKLLQEHDDDDPMKEYLVKEKKEELERALTALDNGDGGERKHRHRHHHRSKKEKDGDREGGEERRRHEHHQSHRRRSRSR